MDNGASVPDRAVAASPSSQQAVSPVPASIPSAVPKVAQVGTKMVRLADARGAAHKIKAYALSALRLAEQAGRDDDRELYLAKLRTATAVINEILENCPVFINAQAIEAQMPVISPLPPEETRG